MKFRTHSVSGLALALALAALVPFLGGCDESAKSAPVTDLNTNETAAPAAIASDTNSPAADAPEQPDTADQQLENAPGTIISSPTASAPSSNPQIGEVVKLVQAGVGDSIVMAYVTNSSSPFKLSSDDIVYLNDLGVSQSVINAMLQRDQYFNSAAQAQAQTPPPDQSGYVNVPAEPLTQPADQNTPTVTDATASADIATPPLNPPDEAVDDAEQAPNGSYSYFYDSLSPYGNWISIAGYGPCWRPTTCAINPGWQPYCDGGHWAYTDCGWCWVSDYSWGWAPFHYGRWFHSVRWGWCWAPDTVWGPAWVSWRYNGGYCGWAALPPAACYRPGFGFTYLGSSVGFNFTFGLSASSFVFVPLDHFHDRVPSHSRVSHREVDKIFRSTTLNNQLIRGPNNTLINRGVPVQQVATASHTEIRAVHIRADVETPGTAKVGRDGRSLSIYRPSLPTARPTAKQTLAGEGVQRDANFNLQTRVDQAKSRPAVTRETPSQPERQPVISNPAAARPPTVTRGATPENGNPSQPVVRSTPNHAQGGTQWPNYQHNQPSQSQPTAPADNSRRAATPQETTPRYSTPQQWQQRPPTQEPNASAPRQNQYQQQQIQQEQVRQQQVQQEQARQQQFQEEQVRQKQFQQQQEQARQQQFQQEQMRQEQVRQNQSRQQEQFRQEQPRQEAPPRNYEQPRSYESHSAPPAQSAPSRQESSQNNSSGNNNGNGGNGNGGGGGGGGGRGR
jgi:hypothetical protein